MKSYSVAILLTATERYFLVVLFRMLCEMIRTVEHESVDEHVSAGYWMFVVVYGIEGEITLGETGIS